MSDDEIQNELVHEFLVESHEGLDRLDQQLLQLEGDPANVEVLSAIFRTFHTIKGTAGFLSFKRLESIAHAAESLLSKLRDGALRMDAERASALLRTVDVLREILGRVESSGAEGETTYPDLIALLTRLAEPGSAAASDPIALAEPAPAAVAFVPAADESAPPSVGSAPPPVAAAPAVAVKPTAAATESEGGARASVDTSIRVDVGVLDTLMNLVGELVLARNQILQHTTSEARTELNATTQRLNRITTDLQEGVMKTRMQPIKSVWSKFPRVVRDLTRACGKRAAIRMEGEDTELDRTILEAIKDPLTHMVRNAVDHAIESPEERTAAGKLPEGTLWLRAYHEGGQVNLEIGDDGRGIDVERVREKALERALVTREKLERMSERDVLQLVFLPGFSTARAVTNVSGRGVGMDVVRTNIEKIGGTVDLQTTRGKGTTVRIKIPLTLAIIPALIVAVGRERYALPQVSLIELVRLEGARARQAIEMVHGAPVFRRRGDLLPLVSLAEQLGGPSDLRRVSDEALLNIVVLQADDRQYGLIVDRVSDTEEIVVKPLGAKLREISLYAGATIMGDGKVALILDARGIAERAGVLGERDESAQRAAEQAESERDPREQTLLLFALENGRHGAIPLNAVARLEEVDAKRIESAGDQLVIQYRDEIMPLVPLNASSAAAAAKADGDRDVPLQVIVHAIGRRSVGLVVDDIHDIVRTSVEVDTSMRRRGTLGSVVVAGRVTDLVDVAGVIRDALPDFAAEPEEEARP